MNGRLRKAAAVIGAAGAGLLAIASPAAADPAAFASPYTHLGEGQTVFLYVDTGLPYDPDNVPTGRVAECAGDPLDHKCGLTFSVLPVDEEVSATLHELVYMGTTTVSRSFNDGQETVTCTNQCKLYVANVTSSIDPFGPGAPIAFSSPK